MKKLLALMILLSFCQVLRAQGELLDKEKLLDFYQTQRYAEAAKYLESVYSSDTENITALSQIAYCYLMSGKLAEAEIKYLKINELKPNTLPVLFSLTNINARRGNKPTAQLYLSNILKIDSTNFNAYKQAAGLTDSIELKLKYLQKANQLNPKEADVAYDLADQLKFLQKFQQAYNVLQVAIDADSGNFVLQQAQLPIANDLKKYQDVIRVGERLLEKGFDGKIVKDVGKAYFYLKNYEKCIAYYKSLEDADLQNETILYYMTISYRELKNLEMATLYGKKTIEAGISPNTALYYSLLGGVYEQRNQFLTAANNYKKGLTFSDYKTIFYRLALVYDYNLKQPKTALSYYQQYVKSNPDNDEKKQVDFARSRIIEMTQPKSSKVGLTSSQN